MNSTNGAGTPDEVQLMVDLVFVRCTVTSGYTATLTGTTHICSKENYIRTISYYHHRQLR